MDNTELKLLPDSLTVITFCLLIMKTESPPIQDIHLITCQNINNESLSETQKQKDVMKLLKNKVLLNHNSSAMYCFSFGVMAINR